MSSDAAGPAAGARDQAAGAAAALKPAEDALLGAKLAGGLRVNVPEQGQRGATAFTSSEGRAAAAAVSPLRVPSSPMMRLLSRRSSYSDRPIDVIRGALVGQRNELCSLVARRGGAVPRKGGDLIGPRLFGPAVGGSGRPSKRSPRSPPLPRAPPAGSQPPPRRRPS
jgi:hypothetical protein